MTCASELADFSLGFIMAQARFTGFSQENALVQCCFDSMTGPKEIFKSLLEIQKSPYIPAFET